MDLVNNYGSSDEEDHQETTGIVSKSSIQINSTPDAGFDVSINDNDDTIILLDRFPNTTLLE